MSVVIIEELNRLGHVSQRHRFNQLPVSIGRAYDNDLIITDPYVSAHHARLCCNEQGWHIEDQGSDNGIEVRHHGADRKNRVFLTQDETAELNRADIHSGDDIIIGHTRLRIMSPQHQIADTHIMPKKAEFARILRKPLTAVAILVAFILFIGMENYLESHRELGLMKNAASIMYFLLAAGFWAGIWAFVGRVITHHMRFIPQLAATLAFFLFLLCLTNLSSYLAYMINNQTLASVIEILLTGFALCYLFRVHFDNSTNLQPRRKRISAHATAWSILLMSLFFEYASQPEFLHRPEFDSNLKPPFAKLAGSRDFDRFLSDAREIFDIEAQEDQ